MRMPGPNLVFVALILAAGIPLCLRHRELRALRAENQRLKQSLVDSSIMAHTSPASVRSFHQSPPASPPLSSEERFELLQLRGQVQPLRDQLDTVTQAIASRDPNPASGAPSSSRPGPGSHPTDAGH